MAANTDPSAKDIRSFGMILVPFVAAVGFFLGHRFGREAGYVIWTLGGTLAAVYVGVPRLRRPIFIAWNRATYPLGVLTSTLLLGAVFIVVISPISLILRILHEDPLERRASKDLGTYWVERDVARPRASYFRQF